MFSSASSREELQERLFCAAVEQEVFGPEPERCFGFWGRAIVHPSLRSWSFLSVDLLAGKHILVVSAAFKTSK